MQIGGVESFGDICLYRQGSNTFAGFQYPASDPPSSFKYIFPTGLPGSTMALAVTATGQIVYQSLGAGGTVTSVAIAAPSFLSVSNSPITASGTINLSLASQSQNTMFAAPNGSSGTPTFRSLVAADIPTLTAAKISDFDSQARTSRLDQFAAPTASVSLNNQKIVALADGTSLQDAATWGQTQALFNGENNKGTARAASTANINLSSPGAAIDGVTMAAGDIFLAKDQTTGLQNGLHVWNGAAVAATRATNADVNAEVRSGLFVFVSEGTTNGSQGYTLTTPNPIILGTTALSFTQTSGAGQINAGNGLSKTGNILDINADATTIEIVSDTLRLKDGGITSAKIANGTIDLTSKVTGTLPLANGGTGATAAANARQNLGAAGSYKLAFTTADLVSGILTINHGLGVSTGETIYPNAFADNNGKQFMPNVTYVSATQMTADLTPWIGFTGTWVIRVVG